MNDASSPAMPSTRPTLMACVRDGMRQAWCWRVMLLWLLALALPLLVAMLPLTLAVAGKLNHSLMGVALAEHGELATWAELVMGLRQSGFNPAPGGLLALGLTLMLSPWLTGMVLAQARAGRRLPLGGLVQGGIAEYGRMLRMLLWALLPLGLAAAAMHALGKAAGEHADLLILESEAQRWQHLAMGVGGLLLLLAHASVDAARALMVAEPRRRSVVRAWIRASLRLFSRPGSLLAYVLVTAAGLALAAGLGGLRLQVPASGALQQALAWLLAEAIVVAIVWMRCARLLALIAVARR